MALQCVLGRVTASISRRSCRPLRAISIAAIAVPALAGAQVAFNVTERALPGETISIYGSGFDVSAHVYGRSVSDAGSLGPTMTFALQGESSSCVVAQVPSTIGGRLWQVWVQTSNGSTTPLYVNRARPVLLDSTDALPNGLVRVFGRNMNAPGTVSETPSVRLLNGTIYLNATVVSSSAYSLTFRVPSTVRAGITYRVFVRNGPGGASGEVECPQQVVGLPNQKDYLGLNIPWASAIRYASNVYNVKTDPRLAVHAVGNGLSNDAPAIRAAIAAAKGDGGGVVYIPSGTYQADDGNSVIIPSNVTLKGDGPGVTVLNFGYRFTPAHPAGGDNWWLLLDVADLGGVMNMTVQNQNTGAVPNQTVGRHWYTAPHAHRFFFSNVDFELGNGAWMFMEGTAKGVMQDCNVTTTNVVGAQQASPLYLGNSDQWLLRRNTFNYRISRIELLFTRHTVFEQNTVNRDNNYSGVAEGGGLETGFCQQLVVQNNTIQGTGPVNHSTNDGELVLSQNSTLPDVSDVGNVTSATSTTLSNSARSWPANLAAPNYGDTPRTVVRIISGKGTGQWRNVIAHSGNTLTVDLPWSVNPDSTSAYSLGSWSNYQQFFLGNTLKNSSYAMDLYDGACDTVVDGNTAINAGHIMLRCNDVAYSGTAGSNRRHACGWFVTLSNNTVSNTDGVHMAQILVSALEIGGSSYGNLVLGADVRNNQVTTTVATSIPYELGDHEGIWNSVVFEGFYDGRSAPGDNLGSIYQGNSFSGPLNAFHDVGTSLTTDAAGVNQGA